MKKQRHQQFGNPKFELDRQHQGSIGGEFLARRPGEQIENEKVSSLHRIDESDFTPGRDPAEGPDVAFTSPSHERWAQHTSERDPSEGAILPSASREDTGKARKK